MYRMVQSITTTLDQPPTGIGIYHVSVLTLGDYQEQHIKTILPPPTTNDNNKKTWQVQRIQCMDILVIPNHNKDNDNDTNNITTTQYQIVMDGDEHLAHYRYWKY